jgi:hypothetical protein
LLSDYKMTNVLISLYDRTGNAARPYRENGWKVYQIDIQNGIDILEWDFLRPLKEAEYAMPQVNIIAMQPCDCYALCGNRHKKNRLLNGEFNYSQKLVAKTKQIIDFYDNERLLGFWMLEQPMTDIHKKNPWLGRITQKFDPCDFAGYDPVPDNSRYNKQTWLFGRFNKMKSKRMEPLEEDNPGWSKKGGRSIETKNWRSVTPLGFAYAFYQANH